MKNRKIRLTFSVTSREAPEQSGGMLPAEKDDQHTGRDTGKKQKAIRP